MDLSIIITGVVGLITTIGSSWTTWFLTRKKYNSEVDGTNIQNMQETLEFYKTLSDYNKERLDEYLRRNEQLEEQVNKLKEGQDTTEDGLFTLECVSCLGACGLAPVMVLDDVVYGQITPAKAAELIDSIVKAEAQHGN